MKIIPAIDILQGKCVRLLQGDYNKETVYSDNPPDMARYWEDSGAEFLHLVDLDGAKKGDLCNLQSIRNIIEKVSIPCELGGGIRDIETAKTALYTGVKRIVLGTTAFTNKEFLEQLINTFGPEKIVVSIDSRNEKVALEGWTKTSEKKSIDLGLELAEIGVKRFVYTDITKDGVLRGPNYKSIRNFCKNLPDCSIVASGGIGEKEHLYKLAEIHSTYNNLEAVIIGKALYDRKLDLKEIKQII